MPVTNRNQKGKSQHAQIDIDFVNARNFFRNERNQQRRAPDRDEKSDQASDGRQEHALGKKLSDYSAAAGAQCAANGHLFPTRRGPGQQQVGDIRAGNQQHKYDGRQQHQQQSLDIPDHLFL